MKYVKNFLTGLIFIPVFIIALPIIGIYELGGFVWKVREKKDGLHVVDFTRRR